MTQPYSNALTLLDATPRAIAALVAGLPDDLLNATDGAGTWSARQVLEHLVWGEVDDWIPRIRLVLETRDGVAFTPFDREGGAKRYGTWGFEKLLAEFLRLRADNLESLRALRLGRGDFSTPGLHPALGAVTLGQLIASWVAHDLAHLDQITRTLARQYKTDVGPWRDFMRVLRD